MEDLSYLTTEYARNKMIEPRREEEGVLLVRRRRSTKDSIILLRVHRNQQGEYDVE
jgi:hypothetical protein